MGVWSLKKLAVNVTGYNRGMMGVSISDFVIPVFFPWIFRAFLTNSVKESLLFSFLLSMPH
jgi:hypothetical protein